MNQVIHMIPDPSPFLTWSFGLLLPVMGLLVVGAVARTSGRAAGLRAGFVLGIWMTGLGLLAGSGFFDQWNPPRFFLVFASILIFLFWASRKPFTERLGDLPLALLVGFQSFRIVVEIMLHVAVEEGVANPTMTWTGTNLDIVPGVTALLLCPFAARLKPHLLQWWNVSMALVLVVTVLGAMLSAPTPLQQIGGDPANVFVSRFPFVWLPGVLVTCAWLGHLVLFKRLRRSPAAS